MGYSHTCYFICISYQRHATTSYTPFQLVYGRQAVLPIETILPVETPDTDQTFALEDSILQRAFELIDELPYYHSQARKHTEQSQKKQKVRFDSRIQVDEFEIGDKVWVQRKYLEASRSAKFEDKRIGPFVIHAKLMNGTYRLRTLQGKTLTKCYNSDRLSRYYEKQNWEPIVLV